jgi:hypothetical protein
MYARERVDEVLALRAKGLSAAAIARRTGIPRSTLRAWIAGHVPRSRSLGGESGCAACGGARHEYRELPPSYGYLLGLYLGDGYLAAHPRGVYKLRIMLDARYPGVIDQCEAAMREVLPSSRVNRLHRKYGDVEVYSYSKAWPCLFPQHGPGKKHLREIALLPWQRELVARSPDLLLRGLIHSDGCRFENTGRKWRHPRYCFTNFSQDIRAIFCEACDQLGLHWTVAPPKTVYVSRKDDVRRLDDFGAIKA